MCRDVMKGALISICQSSYSGFMACNSREADAVFCFLLLCRSISSHCFSGTSGGQDRTCSVFMLPPITSFDRATAQRGLQGAFALNGL